MLRAARMCKSRGLQLNGGTRIHNSEGLNTERKNNNNKGVCQKSLLALEVTPTTHHPRFETQPLSLSSSTGEPSRGIQKREDVLATSGRAKPYSGVGLGLEANANNK